MRRFIRWLRDMEFGAEEFADFEGYLTVEAFRRWEESPTPSRVTQVPVAADRFVRTSRGPILEDASRWDRAA